MQEYKKKREWPKKHVWRVLNGGIDLAPVIIGAWIIRLVVSWGDNFWNTILFLPLFSREMSGAGFVLSILFLYMVGALRETRAGKWFRFSVLGRIPFVGEFFKISGGETSKIFQADIGYVSLPLYNGGYKPGKITAVQKIKDGSYVVMAGFLMIPPLTISLRGSQEILALEKETEDGRKVYLGYPFDVAVQIEFGGTRLAPDALKDCVWVAFEEFLRSQNFLNGNRA